MQHFRLIFDLGMTVWPFAFVLLFPAKPVLNGERLSKYKRRALLLGIATAAAWCLIALVHSRFSGVHGLWTLCFVLWFGGAMPIMRLKRLDWSAPLPDASARQASLHSRLHASPVPKFWWAVAWCVWLLLLAATLATVDAHVQALFPLFFNLMGAFWLIMGQYGLRWFLLEPEPLDAHGSVELRDAYGALRKFKVHGWFGLVIGAMLIFSSVALMIARDAGVVAVVVLGAGGGSLLGVLGGVFGTYASVLRGRIAELRARLDGDHDTLDTPA